MHVPDTIAAMLRRVAGLAAILCLGGCVDRILTVRTEPPGAQVFLDGEPAGRTPCDLKYTWYGTRELVVEMKGRRLVRENVALRPPWWQIFPIDILTDVVIPFTIEDREERAYVLELDPPSEADREEVRSRAAELRERARTKGE